MKKQHFKLSLIGGMLIAMSATVNAQWTETGSAVYLNSTTKNVGIGTTTPAFALDLQRSGSANLSLKSTTGTSNLLLDRANSSATSSVSYRTNGVGTWQTGTVGNDNFNIRNIGLGNTAMSISAANNNVGLGVSTPLIVLDTKVGQTIGTTATSGTIHSAGNQGEKVGFGYASASNLTEFVGMKAVVSPGTNGCGNSGDILFNTWECNTSVSRPVMTINGTGNVGIGPTTPTNRLSVDGNVNVTGNVGIGTTAPEFITDIRKTNGPRLRIFSEDHYWAGLLLENNTRQYFAGIQSTYEAADGANCGYQIFDNTAGMQRFVIDYLGRVGINTPAPAYQLDVTSEGYITGQFINTNPSVSSDPIGAYGSCNNSPYYGIGMLGTGGYVGVRGSADLTGTGERYGVYGIAANGNDNYGVYGYAGGTGTNWGVYSSGATYSTAGYSSSDAKLKKDVRVIDNAMTKINQLQPRTYTFKTEEYNYMGLPSEQQYGFIAQELETVFPELVREVQQPTSTEKNSDRITFKAINYVELIPILTQAMQEQQVQMEAKDVTINSLQSTVGNLQNQLNDMQKCIESLCTNAAESKAAPLEQNASGNLFQNTPNPFNQTTVIRYALNSDNSNGKIIIRDLNGNLVKSIAISNSGKGQVTINANELTSGTYTYTLEIAGASVDTKLMVVTK